MREPAADPTTHPAERRLFPILCGVALGVLASDFALERGTIPGRPDDCRHSSSSGVASSPAPVPPGVAPALPAPAGLSRPILTRISESR